MVRKFKKKKQNYLEENTKSSKERAVPLMGGFPTEFRKN